MIRSLGRGRLIDNLKDTITRAVPAKIIGPIFLYDYPHDISPLAKEKPGEPETAERFQAFAGWAGDWATPSPN